MKGSACLALLLETNHVRALATGAAEEGGEAAAGRPARGWGDISFVLPFVLTTAGGLFGIAAGMTVLLSRCFYRIRQCGRSLLLHVLDPWKHSGADDHYAAHYVGRRSSASCC